MAPYHNTSGIMKKQENLERVLIRTVKEAEEESASTTTITSSSSSCTLKIFDAVLTFLTSWDALEREKDEKNADSDQFIAHKRNIPQEYLRITLCNVFANLDLIENSDFVRDHVLSTMESIGTVECLSVLLEFLPAIAKVVTVDDCNFDSRSNYIQSKMLKKDIFSTLKNIFWKEPNSLSQILQSLSSVLEGTVDSGDQLLIPKDVFNFIIGILHKVPESDLPVALQTLIGYVDNASDARLAVDEIRKELALLEGTFISDMFSMAIVFADAVKRVDTGCILFVEEYLVVVEEIIHERRRKKLHQSTRNTVIDPGKYLLTFDLVMILLSKNRPPYRHQIMGMISGGNLVQSGLLSDFCPSKIIELVDEGDDDSAKVSDTISSFDSNIRKHIFESLVDFSLAILVVYPRKLVQYNKEEFFSNVQCFIFQILFSLPKEFQLDLISTALEIAEKIAEDHQIMETSEKNHPWSGIEEEDHEQICRNIYSLIVAVAHKKSEILTSFKNRFMRYLVSDALNNIRNYNIVESLSLVIVKLACNDARKYLTDLIISCRALLFSSAMMGTTELHKFHDIMIRRQIRGMILINTIIFHHKLDNEIFETISKWLSRIMVSNTCALDPRVGIIGIEIIRRLGKHEGGNVLFGKELFQLVTLVLSNSRIVQYSYKPNTLLAYSEIPSLFSQRCTKERRRKMVFCLDNFVCKETQLHKWKDSSSFIFKLFNSYLTIGRTANWNPHAWVYAEIEFPAVSSYIPIRGTKELKLLEWMRSEFMTLRSSRKNNVTTVILKFEKQFTELIKGTRTVFEKESIVDSISRFTVSMLHAISLLAATLCNTHDHFKGVLGEEDQRLEDEHKKEEAFQMIHYQLNRIYELKEICQSIEPFFRKLGSNNGSFLHKRSKKRKRRNLNKPTSIRKTNIQIHAELAAFQLKETLTHMFCSANFIPSEILWTCLIDPSHDAKLISFLENPNNCEGTEIISAIINTKINLIEHLATTAVSSSHNDFSEVLAILQIDQPMLRQYTARSLRLASFLLLKLQSVQDTNMSDSLTSLISEYLKLLRTILISKIYSRSDLNENDDFVFFFDLYLSIIGSKQPLDDAIDYKENNANNEITSNQFKILISACEDHIGCCHNFIDLQLLETLSIFAAKSEAGTLQDMMDMHWKATFTSKHAHFTDIKNTAIDMPFVLQKLFEKSARCTITHELAAKLMTGCFRKSGERNIFLIHSMCRHWGLIASSPRKSTLFSDCLEILLGKIWEYMRGTDNDYNLAREKVALKYKEDSLLYDNGDGEYLPPSTAPQYSKPSIPTLNNFACLTSSNYPIFFDVLLRMTVSSIALFSIHETAKTFKKSWIVIREIHPVHKLIRMVIVYGSLIKLYKDKFHFFPKFLLPSIIHTSKCMVDISMAKVCAYIQWRDSQPVVPPEHKNPSVIDITSISFLKDLLDAFGQNVIGALRAFYFIHSESADNQGNDNGSVEKEQQSFFGNTAMPRINSLSRKVEKGFDSFCQTSNRYNTGNIKTKFELSFTPDTKRIAKNARIELEDLLLSDQLTTGNQSPVKVAGEETLEAETTSSSFLLSKRHRYSDRFTSNEDYDPEGAVENESLIDDESSSMSDAFGVSGNWGQDTIGEEFDSVYSRSIQEIKITK